MTSPTPTPRTVPDGTSASGTLTALTSGPAAPPRAPRSPEPPGAPPRPGVVAVLDSDGVTRTLPVSGLTDVTAGCVAVLARPGMRRISWLAADLLRALGCRDDVTGAARPGEGDWTLVEAWLRAHQIRDVVVQHAWTMPFAVLEELLDLPARTGVTLWLVGDTPCGDTRRAILAPANPAFWCGEEFLTAWRPLADPTRDASDPRTGPPAPVPDAPVWPQRVHDDDFTTFRAACRDLLDPEAFELVDRHFCSHVTRLRGEVRRLAESGDITEETVATLLAQAWETTTAMSEYLTVVRAAQVAFFHAGWYLQVDLDQLIGTASTMPRRALRTPQTWTRLRGYPEPHRGAVCALAAAGLSVHAIRQLTLGCYAPATGRVQLPGGRSLTVEADARIFLTAQAELRTLAGAWPDGLLFVTRAGAAASENALVRVINDARRELGVAVAPARLDRKPITGDRWNTRWGVCLQELT